MIRRCRPAAPAASLARLASALCGGLLLLAVALPLSAQAPLVDIRGASGALASNIRSHLRITEQPCDTSLVSLRRRLPDIEQAAQEAARALGWYDMDLNAAFEAGEACWVLRLDVVPGPPVLLEAPEFTVAGEHGGLFRQVLADSGLREGAQLHHGQYESFKNALSARAVENGYFSARFQRSEIRLDLQNRRARIVVDFDPGLRSVFGDIAIDTRDALSDSFVRRMLSIEPGQPYSSESLLRLREDLDESLYFQQIGITPQLGASVGGRVPLQISLTPRPRHAYTVGIGFSTDTGPRVRLNYENRYLNRQGHQWKFDSDLSPVRSQLDLSYRLPLRDPVRESLDFSGGLIQEDTTTFKSQRFMLAGTYRNDTVGGWKRNLFVNYQLDDYELAVDEDRRALTMLGVNASKTRADNLIFPTRGWKLFSELRGASDTLLSDVTFLQLYLSAKGIMGLGGGRLITRLESGSTWVDDVLDLPVSTRFFAGGDQSIRGYEYRSLGPLGRESGEIEGGRHLVVASLEYDYPVRENWRLAAFYDSGNAFNDTSNFDRFDTVGFGVRWISPIGPLRADLAFPLEGEDSFRLHITMGPDL